MSDQTAVQTEEEPTDLLEGMNLCATVTEGAGLELLNSLGTEAAQNRVRSAATRALRVLETCTDQRETIAAGLLVAEAMCRTYRERLQMLSGTTDKPEH